jgi:surface polysaccharide O-acyltransferase-like enzyme
MGEPDGGGVIRAFRDTDLDDYRALALVWVVFIHCLYLAGIVPPTWNVAKSLLLVEMPVLFYVAGAANGRGRARPVAEFYASRLGRILIPYWVYAAVCLALEAGLARGPLRPFSERVLGWLVPVAAPRCAIAPLGWGLWFIPVYLLVMLAFPWMRAAHARLSGWARSAPLLALAGVVVAMDRAGYRGMLPRALAVYSFWAYLGLFHERLRSAPPPRGAVVVFSLAVYGLLAVMVRWGVYGPDFQWNKFPPNGAFLLLGLGHFGLLSLAAHAILAVARKASVRRLLAPYRNYGYTIYLNHMLVFAVLFRAFERWPGARLWGLKHPVAAIALMFPVMAVLIPVVAWPFSPAERLTLWPRRTAAGGSRRDFAHPGAATPASARPGASARGRERSGAPR